MADEWESTVAEIRSGDTDRVNTAIERLDAVEMDARGAVWTQVFDPLTDLYDESDDGYTRQAVVRAVEAVSPGLASAVNAVDSMGPAIDEATLRDRLDTACGFLLEALQDEDGRVRQSAIRALKGCFRAYEGLEDDETIEAIGAELEDLASECTGSRREHVLEAKEDAQFFSRPGGVRMIEAIRGLIQEAAHRD